MTLYDRPVRQLIEDALNELGDTFAANDMLRWFASRYPKVNPRTIRQHLRGMSANDPTKQHMPSLKQVFIKLGRSQYRVYDADRDGLFDDKGRPVAGEEDQSDLEADLEEPTESGLEFDLELHLEDFMETNWDRIDFGRPLRLHEGSNGEGGRQFQTAIGLIDFLCEDTSTGDLVVVELKRGRSSDAALGQCQRYMGWVREHLARPEQRVQGLIIAAEQDDRLRYALLAAPDVDVRCFEVDFRLFDPNSEDSSHD